MDIGKYFSIFSKQRPMPKIALVLGGGAARGFAHVGVIRVLEQEQVPIDMIVGTSVGSLIGAIYAYDVNSFELEWSAFTLERDDVFDYDLRTVLSGMGAAKGDKLEEFVRAKVPTVNIEDLKIPFAAVATDLNRGARVVLDRGPVARAVRASCAIPGVFPPVEHQGSLLVDGGVLDNIPASVARERGADIVIAVDISVNVVNRRYHEPDRGHCPVHQHHGGGERDEAGKWTPMSLSRRTCGSVGMMDFGQKKVCMQAGIEAAQRALPDIRNKIEAWRRA